MAEKIRIWLAMALLILVFFYFLSLWIVVGHLAPLVFFAIAAVALLIRRSRRQR